jgi:hypothetical protein
MLPRFAYVSTFLSYNLAVAHWYMHTIIQLDLLYGCATWHPADFWSNGT